MIFLSTIALLIVAWAFFGIPGVVGIVILTFLATPRYCL